jgi:hypothetical protein
MGKRRCAFENERVDQSELREISGFLVHVHAVDEGWAPVNPPHEAIEGRLLSHDGDGFKLKTVLQIHPPLARPPA